MTKNFKLFSESIILAAIPALGYWVAFVYELGYFNYFELPRSFIEIALNSVLLNSLSVVSGLFFFFIVFDFIRRAMSGVTEALRYILYRLLFVCFLVFGFGLIFDKPIEQIQVLLFIVATPIIFKDILWPLWSHRHIKGFGNKIAAARKQDLEFDSVTDKLVEKAGIAPFLIVIFIYLFSIFSYLAGGYQANKQEHFLTSKERPSFILVRKYNDKWLSLKVDVVSQEFHETYELIPSDKISVFSNTNIGKLKKRQKDNSTGGSGGGT
ncbi:hypothetical protein [Thalassotalea castellviae]|uniref:Uncharacterized protein n=1 Tax=Thalassotalea castellviae TaxID=3075612 RepID=A0ABU2ZW77_9GAMM|nr:hypothetical protein [Thalassotalea sp. W431]MDT0602187.1 hypothetical protein [Thalassotalea sp. W431]